jgi:hypothetical protein
VDLSVYTIFWIASGATLLIVLGLVFVVATAGEGPRRDRATLAAWLIVGLWLCSLPLVEFLDYESLAIYESSGIITLVNVPNEDSWHFSEFLTVRTSSGGDIVVHASGPSRFFQEGQHIKVRYRDDTAEIIDARFFGADGRYEGIFRATSSIRQLVAPILGIFCIWLSIRGYRRNTDPEAELDPELDPDLDPGAS